MTHPELATFPDIALLLPHSAPMLLLDRLVRVSDTSACCEVKVGERLALFLEPDGSLPGWIGIELMAQSVAAWSGYQGWLRGEPPQIGLLLGARKYDALQPRLPAGALLTIEVSQLLQDGGLSSFNCLIYCAGERVAEARLSTLEPTEQQLTTLLGSSR